MPMSASAVVNRGELLELHRRRSRRAVDEAFADVASEVLADRDVGRRRGPRARPSRSSPRRRTSASRSSPTPTSTGSPSGEADEIVENARAEAEALRKETDDYVDAKLANFEIALERTIEAVKRGRERLRRPLGLRRPDLGRGRQDQAARSTSRTDPGAASRRPADLAAGPPLGTLDDGSSRPVLGRPWSVGRGIWSVVPCQEVNPCVSTRERRSCSTPASSAAARGRSAGELHGAGSGRPRHRGAPRPRRVAGRVRAPARGGHGGRARHR